MGLLAVDTVSFENEKKSDYKHITCVNFSTLTAKTRISSLNMFEIFFFLRASENRE